MPEKVVGTPQGVKPKGMIVDMIRDLILARVPTSPEWAEYLACVIVSVAAGKDCRIKTNIAPKGLGLNLFIVYVGPSGLSYKTLPVRHYIIPVLQQFQEKTQLNVVLPVSGSTEGMIEYFANKDGKGSNEGIIMKDEFTLLFKDTRKDYLSDEMELYSQWYDGTMQKRITRKTGLDQATEVYVNLEGTTTPMLYSMMQPEFFVQGIGNRICWILYDHKQRVQDDPQRYMYNPQMEKKYEEEISEITSLLMDIRNHPVKRLLMIESASALIDKFRSEMDDQIEKLIKQNPKDLRASYLARQVERLMKFAGIHFIAKIAQYPTSHIDGIDEKDVEWALVRVRKLYENFNNMLTDWRDLGSPLTIRTNEYYEQAMLEVIAKYKPCTSSTIYKHCQWGSNKVHEILDSLLAANIVKRTKAPSTGGAPPIVYEVVQ